MKMIQMLKLMKMICKHAIILLNKLFNNSISSMKYLIQHSSSSNPELLHNLKKDNYRTVLIIIILAIWIITVEEVWNIVKINLNHEWKSWLMTFSIKDPAISQLNLKVSQNRINKSLKIVRK